MIKVLRLKKETKVFYGYRLGYCVTVQPGDHEIDDDSWVTFASVHTGKTEDVYVHLSPIVELCGENAEVVEVPENEADCYSIVMKKYHNDTDYRPSEALPEYHEMMKGLGL